MGEAGEDPDEPEWIEVAGEVVEVGRRLDAL